MNAVFSWLPVAISVVIFLGAAAVYLRGSKDKGTIATLESNNDALAKRVDILEHDNGLLKTRVEVVERENGVLRDVVGAKDEVSALHNALDMHHAAAMAGMSQIHDDLDGIAAGIASAISGGGTR